MTKLFEREKFLLRDAIRKQKAKEKVTMTAKEYRVALSRNERKLHDSIVRDMKYQDEMTRKSNHEGNNA